MKVNTWWFDAKCIFFCSLLFLLNVNFAYSDRETDWPSEPDENNNLDNNDGNEAKDLTTNCECGKGNSNNKIVGGVESKQNAWPWMAAIVNVEGGDNDWRIHCGGSIICDRYILTAAHCIPSMMEAGFDLFRILVGDNAINSGNATATNRKVLEIKSIKSHPRFNSKTFDFDAALIKLKTNLNFNEDVLPVCLGQAGRLFVNRTATVAGWGTTFFGGQSVNKLREVQVKITTNSSCNEAYMQTGSGGITKNQLCAMSPSKDSCQGDSGGPLFLERVHVPNIYKQVGIVSFGQECASDTHPGVYTRVQRIISWIKALTKDGRYCSNSFIPNYRDGSY